jgi:hypothetical protein
VHRDVWHAVHAQEVARIAGQIVDVHADEDDATALRPCRRGEESRLALARRAPRRPEVEDDRITAKIGKP